MVVGCFAPYKLKNQKKGEQEYKNLYDIRHQFFLLQKDLHCLPSLNFLLIYKRENHHTKKLRI